MLASVESPIMKCVVRCHAKLMKGGARCQQKSSFALHVRLWLQFCSDCPPAEAKNIQRGGGGERTGKTDWCDVCEKGVGGCSR